MRRQDPYSTPARRRRIINDVAKSVLRQYCIAACNNVIRFRKETKASIVVQCAIRSFVARCKLRSLIFQKKSRAAIRIQSIWRMKLAGMLKIKLRKELCLRQATRLALCVQTLYRNRKERLHRIALMVARKLALEKKRNHAAIEIQRVFRGELGRRRFAGFIAARAAYHLRRKRAAIVIQTQMRRCLAVVVVAVRRTRRKTERMRQKLKFNRWLRHFRRHRTSVVVCQSVIRMFLAKRRVAAYRRLLAQMRLDKMSEVRPVSPYQIPLRRDPSPTKTMNIQVDLSSSLLSEMAAAGPRCVVAWCVDNYILHYHARRGYALGAVVQQVVHSVDSLLESEVAAAAPASNTSAAEDGKVIMVAKWDEGQASDVPETRYLPEGWDKACCGVEGSAEVSVHLLSSRLEVRVRVDNPLPVAPPVSDAPVEYSLEEGRSRLVFDFRSRIDVPPVVTHSLIVIVLNAGTADASSLEQPDVDLLKFQTPQTNEYRTLASSTSADVSAIPAGSTKVKAIDEAKFRFKNALVQITTPVTVEDTPPPAPPSPPPPPIGEDTTGGEIIVFDDELSDDSLIEELPKPEATSVRPQTATVVRIVLRDPTPPPPDLDYMARRIQFMLRRRLDLKNVAAEYIQSMFYHHHMLYRWRSVVKLTMERAVRAVSTLQRMVRCHQARVVLFDLRRKYRYCPDFSLDEEVNWASFGMINYRRTSVDKVSAVEANSSNSTVMSNPVVPPPLVARITTGVSGKFRFGSSDAGAAAGWNPVGDLLDLIQLPGPPPGCILSSNPLMQLPPRSVSNDYSSSATGGAVDDALYHHARSVNAEVRHCVLRYVMPAHTLTAAAAAVSSGDLDGHSILSNYVAGAGDCHSSGSIVDLMGSVFCNNSDTDWRNLAQGETAKVEASVSIAPVYNAIASKYR